MSEIPAQPVRKPDRRVLRTRDRLGDALIALLLAKPFEDITVQEVLDRAEVSRSTFYEHYRDKNDLFLSEMDEFFEAMSTLLERTNDRSARVAPVAELFAHVAESRELYAVLTESGRMHDVRELGEAHLRAPSRAGSSSNSAATLSRMHSQVRCSPCSLGGCGRKMPMPRRCRWISSFTGWQCDHRSDLIAIRAFMLLNTLMIIASLTTPVCIISFVRREVVSVPFGIIAFVVFMSAVPDLTISIWERLCTNSLYGFFYVWFWYSLRKLSRWQWRARVNPANQKPPVFWRWALLCAWTCNATLLVISFVEACRGYPYPNGEAFPFRVSFIEAALLVSTLFLFIASPLLFERCGTLAFLSWMTIVGLFFWGLLCPQF